MSMPPIPLNFRCITHTKLSKQIVINPGQIRSGFFIIQGSAMHSLYIKRPILQKWLSCMQKLCQNKKLKMKLKSKDTSEDDTMYLPFFDPSFVVRMGFNAPWKIITY